MYDYWCNVLMIVMSKSIVIQHMMQDERSWEYLGTFTSAAHPTDTRPPIPHSPTTAAYSFGKGPSMDLRPAMWGLSASDITSPQHGLFSSYTAHPLNPGCYLVTVLGLG